MPYELSKIEEAKSKAIELEKAGKLRDALRAYDELRKLDPDYSGIDEKINQLQNEIDKEIKKEAIEKAQLEAEELERQKIAKEKKDRETAGKKIREKKAKEVAEKERLRVEEEAKQKDSAEKVRLVAVERNYTNKSNAKISKGNSRIKTFFSIIGITGILGILGFFVIVFAIWLIIPNIPSTTPSTSFTKTPTNTSANVIEELPIEITDATGTLMMLVPEGIFNMGRNPEESLAACQQVARISTNLICRSGGLYDDNPVHEVYLSTFYMDKYEVTNANYMLCVEANVCNLPEQIGSSTREDYYGNSEFDNYPVIAVTWIMANNYCEWRGARLPTEAEWEKAARGTDERTYPWGDEGLYDCSKTNYAGCKDDTTSVGSYETDKSPYGIYDLLGNVEEWVADWYLDSYYQNSSASNPQGPTSTKYRSIRGTNWSSLSFGLPNRWYDLPIYSTDARGFRCAKDANP